MAMSLQKMTQDFLKLVRFEGGNFRRWQKKIHFLLTTLKVVYVLTTPSPVIPEDPDDETMEQARKRGKWENDDYICRGHILYALSDSLFDVYQNSMTAKELWDALNDKYLSDDATSKKFLVSQFMNYRMVDTKPVIDQLHEIQYILSQFKIKNMHMDESTVVSSIIDKLPTSWKYYKKELKCKTEKDCQSLKRKNSGGNSGASRAKNSKFVAVVSEANTLEDAGDWWIDSCATKHVCNDKRFFIE